FELLGVQTLLWVPQQPDAPVRVQGQSCLAPADCRHLEKCIAKMPERHETGLLFCNDVQGKSWGPRFPNVSNLMAFAVTDQKVVIGWVIALNKRESVRACESAERGALSAEHPHVASSASLGAPVPFRRSDAALLSPFVALLGLHARASENYQDIKN